MRTLLLSAPQPPPVLLDALRARNYEVETGPLSAPASRIGAGTRYDLILIAPEGGADALETALSEWRTELCLDHGLVVVAAAGLDPSSWPQVLQAGADDLILDRSPQAIDARLAVIEQRLADRAMSRNIAATLRESEQRFQLAIQGANDGIWDWDLRRNRIYYSHRWCEMLGFRAELISDSPDEWFSRIHPADRARFHQELSAHLNGKTDHFESEFRMLHRNGTYQWVLTRGAGVHNDAGVLHRLAGSLTDISERGVFDPLTGLANRTLFYDRLQASIERYQRDPDHGFAVLFLDLDRFKLINDSLGHLLGDRLLVAMARRLEHTLRNVDTVARLGGDEFAVLLEGTGTAAAAQEAAGHLLAELSQPFQLQGRTVHTTVSMGLTVSSLGRHDADDYLRAADTAMYEAKRHGRGQYQVYTDAMHSEAVATLDLDSNLRTAIARDEFEVYYQPIVRLGDGKLEGLEALVRWNRPTHRILGSGKELLLPGSFLPYAEETGLIVPIGWWVLEQALADVRSLVEQFPVPKDLAVSVNLSAQQFAAGDPAEKVRAALDRSGVDPCHLKLEVTESMVMAAPDRAARILGRLQKMGVRISIDDFGTGYSSLSHLTHYPIDTLKIDQSFVSDMLVDGDKYEVVRTIVSLAGGLKKHVVAEGVETVPQLEALRELGCDAGQGYYFSRPMGRTDVRKFVAHKPHWLRQMARAASD